MCVTVLYLSFRSLLYVIDYLRSPLVSLGHRNFFLMCLAIVTPLHLFSVCGQPGSPLLVCAGHIRSLLNCPNTPTCPSCVKPCPCPLLLFSVLGMFLFGGKFCIRPDGSGECTCREILNPESGCLCTRMHFNNFLWATVTVFQVSE